jgi:glycogen debranching enzyme
MNLFDHIISCKMKLKAILLVLFPLVMAGCFRPGTNKNIHFYQQLTGFPSLAGKSQYLASPFVTAGDRVYIVGYQDGSFPALGWHIKGEMGGIWDHPIKLMDGFNASMTIHGSKDSLCLNKADQFINYPIGNCHLFRWNEKNIAIQRYQFVPDTVEGAVIEYRIINEGKEEKQIDFLFTGFTNLMPTWLGERTSMTDAEDEISFDEKLLAAVAKDKNNPWFVVFGSSLPSMEYSRKVSGCRSVKENESGSNASLAYSFVLKPHEEKVIPFFIAGSYHSRQSAVATYSLLKSKGMANISAKAERYRQINNVAHLTIPDKGLEQMYEWLKYNTDWLIRNVPEQGRGLSAGLPDYPWWFGCDASYALQGVLATGDHELVKSTILLLHKISQRENGNGRIIHEVSTNGAVYNPGNVNETAQYITLLMNYFNWTGDKSLITNLFPDVKKGIDWLLKEQDPDKNGYPDGNGMMEIAGLNTEMIDVAVYTQQALTAASKMAQALGENDIAGEYRKVADELRNRINKDWWNELSHSYGDFRGTITQVRPLLRDVMTRADTLKKFGALSELKNTEKQLKNLAPGQRYPFVIYHNWVVNTPLETGIADAEKGAAALQTARKYENPFGVYVTGIDKSEEPDSIILKSREKTFSYLGAVMTIPTGVQAVAAANYGTADDALRYLEMLHRSFSFALPGSMYEVSPDFGMMTQAWNIYGVAVTITGHFFGIQPRAYEKAIFISPHLPTKWDNVSLDNVKIGENSFCLAIQKRADHREYHVRQTQKDWTVIIDVGNSKKVLVDGKETAIGQMTGGELKITGPDHIVKIY